jgi:aspartate 1-decarboxylase
MSRAPSSTMRAASRLPVLMKAAHIMPFQLVHINNMSNAAHWETYVIPGKHGNGEICLNGCPARLFQPGDEVIVLSLEQLTREEATHVEQKVVFVDTENKLVRMQTKHVDGSILDL